MSIQVISNSTDQPKVETPEVEKKEEIKAAPDAEASEQKEATDSETVETEEEKLESKDDSDDESEESDDSDKPKKKESGFHRRLRKLTAQKADAMKEAEYWRQVALEKSGDKPKEESKVETKVDVSGKPKADDYESYTDFAEALADWKVEQKLKARDQEAEKKSLEAKEAEVDAAFKSRIKSFSEKTPDYDEVIENLDGLNSVAVAQIVRESENGPAILYALGKDPKEAKRICSLSPIQAAKELGKIEAKILSQSSEPKPEPKKITKAPQPIEPVRSKGGQIKKDINDPNLSQKEFEELRREQIRARASSW